MEKCNFCAKTPETKLKCVCGGVVYCDKTCQRADWKRHKSDCPPFVVRKVGEKGRGLFATRNLSRGTCILKEDPVLKMLHPKQDTEKLFKDFNKLSKEIQTKVLDLHDASPGDDLETKIVRIMNTNSCRHVNQKLNTESQNLYLTNSMINHSCNPNCCWKPSDDSDTNKVMTLINIKKGAELTVNYYFSITDERGEFCLTTAERWIKIMTMYHFECLCHECLQGEKLDGLRKQYQKLDRDLEPGFSDIESTLKILKIAEIKLELGKKLDNQVLLRDLLDCLIPSRCLMDMVFPGTEHYREKFTDYMVEVKAILDLYPDCFTNKLMENLPFFD